MVELIIKKQESKPLLERDEIKATVESKTTPSNEEVRQALASKFNKQPETIVIKKIQEKFGTTETQIYAYIYNSKESRDKFEPQHKKKKAGAEAGKPGEKAEEKK